MKGIENYTMLFCIIFAFLFLGGLSYYENWAWIQEHPSAAKDWDNSGYIKQRIINEQTFQEGYRKAIDEANEKLLYYEFKDGLANDNYTGITKTFIEEWITWKSNKYENSEKLYISNATIGPKMLGSIGGLNIRINNGTLTPIVCDGRRNTNGVICNTRC